MLHVSHYLEGLLAVSHCLYGPMELLQVCMFLTVSYGCCMSLTFSTIPWSSYMSLTVSFGY